MGNSCCTQSHSSDSNNMQYNADDTKYIFWLQYVIPSSKLSIIVYEMFLCKTC